MLRHCVVFKFRPDLTPGDVVAIAGAVDDFYASYQGFSSAHHGVDLGIREGNYDYGITVDFEDRKQYLEYAEDPAHLELIAKYIAPNLVARAAVQFEF